MAQLRRFLVEHPELIRLFGFPLAVSNPGVLGLGNSASLPTARHLTRMLRSLPNRVLQALLDDSARRPGLYIGLQAPPQPAENGQ
jgi:hypothetical protein